MQTPFPQSFWVREGAFLAGHYPGAMDPAEADAKLRGLLGAGIRRVVSLIPETEGGRGGKPFRPYAERLSELAAAEGFAAVECSRIGFPDAGVPTPARMAEILDVLDGALRDQRPVYLHCWGGHGRTGTTVACHLVRHGATPEAAIRQLLTWRRVLPRNWHPFENAQESFVRDWRAGK